MANKNLLKKIAPVILSATVAMTGMPSAVFAAEFSDEEVVLDGSAEDEEADVEIADAEADVAEDEADTDIAIADADENADDAETAEEELSDAEEVFGTEGETEAFAEEGNAVESGFVYGTANIPYADFFYGEMNDVQLVTASYIPSSRYPAAATGSAASSWISAFCCTSFISP